VSKNLENQKRCCIFVKYLKCKNSSLKYWDKIRAKAKKSKVNCSLSENRVKVCENLVKISDIKITDTDVEVDCLKS